MKWEVRSFQSGTVVIVREGQEPHYYVYGPHIEGDKESRVRYQTALDVCEYLNGGTRPQWLDDFKRTSEEEITHPNGSNIFATGPMYDANPPALNWQVRMDIESKNARARLIDTLKVK